MLILILSVAAALRLYGMAWDGGLLFHPDERHILVVANRISFPWPPNWGLLLSPESPWNPGFFAYGSLPIYLLRLTADLAGRLDPNYATLHSSYLVGRTLSALFDLGTVALVFRLGFTLHDEWVGLLAAALTALTVLHVQLAHFFAVDTVLAFFVLLTIYLAIGLVDRPSLGRGLVVGLAWGAALATKVSAAPLALAVAAAWILGSLAQRANRRFDRDVPPHALRRSECNIPPQAIRRSERSDPPQAIRRSERSEEPCLSESRPLGFARGDGKELDRESATSRKGREWTARQGRAVAGIQREDSPWRTPFRALRPFRAFATQTPLAPRADAAVSARGAALAPTWRRAVGGIFVTGLTALLTFVALQPYAAIDPVTFIGDVVQESRMASGAEDVPYTRQFIGTLPYVYPIRQAIVWSLGVPLGIAGFAAMLVATARAAMAAASRSWRRAGDLAVPLAWVLPYLGVVGGLHAKFLRYLLPIFPFLSLWAAWLLVTMVRAATRRVARLAAWGVLLAVLGGTALYAVAYLNVYTQTHPWLQTTAWLCENLPSGSRIAVEHWDDTLPLLQAQGELRCARRHRITQLPVYDRDDQAKLDMLLDGLEGNDFIVLASNRLYNTIPRLPGRYPLTSRYYHLLLAEELGFELVHTAATYPRVLGVDIVHDTFSDPDLPKPALLREIEAGRRALVLGRADESYAVYDHPMTLVFKKVAPLSRQELLERFGDAARDLPPPRQSLCPAPRPML